MYRHIPIFDTYHRADAPTPSGARRFLRVRLRHTIATLGVCFAAAAAVMVTGALANPHPVKASIRASAQRGARKIIALEAKGYVPASCTVAGTLMRNHHTGRSVLVRW